MTQPKEWTRDKIPAMDIDELNLSVSEVIFGRNMDVTPEYKGVEIIWPNGRKTIVHENYAGSMYAAWLVVEKMNETHWFNLGSWKKGEKVRAKFGKYELLTCAIVNADTAPEAICKAALLAVMDL